MKSKTKINRTQFPHDFITFIHRKLEKNRKGGRPNFLHVLAADNDVHNEVLNILELAWVKRKPLRKIARKFGTSYDTIRRLTQNVETLCVKEELVELLLKEPCRMTFFNTDLETSDCETVQAYINRAKRDGVKHWKRNVMTAWKAWKALGLKDPKSWTADEVVKYLSTLTDGAASMALDAIRQIAPQIADKHSPHYVGTGRFREKLRRHKKDIFGREFMMIVEALRSNDLTWEETVLKFHVTLGAREGSTNHKSGICGISWDRFHKNFTRVDLWESKVRGGIWSRNCPVDLLFRELPQTLERIWMEKGKPTTAKVIEGGYDELLDIYKRIRQACAHYWEGKTEPDVLKELTTLLPHDADRIHVNLLWEAEVPLEVVAGQDLGRGEAL